MRDDAKLYLDRRISRRAFVSRLTIAGVAAGAAAGFARQLEAAQPPIAAPAGRVV